jgi:hypothetical protein
LFHKFSLETVLNIRWSKTFAAKDTWQVAFRKKSGEQCRKYSNPNIIYFLLSFSPHRKGNAPEQKLFE